MSAPAESNPASGIEGRVEILVVVLVSCAWYHVRSSRLSSFAPRRSESEPAGLIQTPSSGSCFMTKNGFARQAERELRDTRALSQSTRQAWENLSAGEKTAFDRAMAFLGGFPGATSSVAPPATSEADRIAAARLMLLKMGLDSGDPRWSSGVLDRVLNAVVETPQGGVGDMFSALFGVLGDYSPHLTGPVAGLIKDLVVRCFTGYRASYDAVDWKRLVGGLGPKAPTAQLYLALLAVPAPFVTSQLAETIRNALACTPFSAEAASALAT
jgi:hypothetical protein